MREPSWRDAYTQLLARTQMTHVERIEHIEKHGDPCKTFGSLMSRGYGLVVVESTSDFIFGSHFLTPIDNQFFLTIGRNRAAVLTADHSYGAKTVPDPVLKRYNKQTLTLAEFCGGHPSTKRYLSRNKRRLGAGRKGYKAIELGPYTEGQPVEVISEERLL